MSQPSALSARITIIGGPTVLLEIGELRLLTDPTFDPAGTMLGMSSKTIGPALAADSIGQIDAVLLSHDHPDNLDGAGRTSLSKAATVITTIEGAKRLGGNAIGLSSWQTIDLPTPTGLPITITATPARHGPEGIEAQLGDVTGFALSWKGQERGVLYISGDTVWYAGVAEVGKRMRVNTALLFLGAVQLDAYGPEHLTMSGAEAALAAQSLGVHTIIPIHWQGWSHYRETREQLEQAFTIGGVTDRVRWLPPGISVELDV